MAWDMRITPQALAELGPRATIRVAVTTIRDGSQGVEPECGGGGYGGVDR
jgi:hypothetical protein